MTSLTGPGSLGRLALAPLALTLACSGAPKARTAARPAWIDNCPKAATSLYFCADVSQAPDEGMAKELAVQKAMALLTQYVGAEVKSKFKSTEREVNGVFTQEIQFDVDVGGTELVIKEATVKKQESSGANDGTFDGYAMVEWPKHQYDALLASQQAQAKRALELFLGAKQAASDNDTGRARDQLGEARKLLGPGRNTIVLGHAEYRDTAVLRTAMDTLAAQLDQLDKERASVCAVGLLCVKDGAPTACRASRIGVLREAVSRSGRKVSADSVPEDVIAQILNAEDPRADAKVRSAGCIVAARMTADFMANDGTFTYIRAGARASIYDTASRRIVFTHEVTPEKIGFIDFDGAMQKGFNQAEKVIAEKITGALGSR